MMFKQIPFQMRRVIIRIIFCLALIIPDAVCAGTNDSPADGWLPASQTLTYKVYWGIIPLGRAHLNITSETVEKDGRELILLKASVKTDSLISKIYPVDYYMESVVEPGSFLPLGCIEKLKEGRRAPRNNKIVFNRAVNKAYLESDPAGTKKSIDIDENSRDALSYFTCYGHSEAYEAGKAQKLGVFTCGKINDIEVVGLTNEIVNAGEFGPIDCIKVELRAKFGGILKKGCVYLWISNDERRLFFKVIAASKIASFKVFLVEIKRGG